MQRPTAGLWMKLGEAAVFRFGAADPSKTGAPEEWKCIDATCGYGAADQPSEEHACQHVHDTGREKKAEKVSDIFAFGRWA